MLLMGSALLFVFAATPLGAWLLAPLEQRFPPIELCGPVEQQRIDGIVLLGGAINARTRNGAVRYDLNDAADRITYAASLARSHPNASIFISGGQVFPRAGAVSEAEVTARELEGMGIERSRVVLETGSRTTAENAAFSARDPRLHHGRWVLVTSAFHMPRAMGVFRKQGLDLVAAPTDWRLDEAPAPFSWSVAGQLGNLDLAGKEYLGLLGYWLTGRSGELFPAPRRECAS
jgi:uncharacterized SAM-binding protein YcdF (DUF218 family)